MQDVKPRKVNYETSVPGFISRNTVLLFGVYLIAAFILRFFTLFPSVINHDESTYIIIAYELLQGGTYWVDLIDTKPIGIFLLFGLFQSVFGYNIISIRLIAIIWVALTALFINRAHRKVGGDSRAALSSGFLFILMTSMFVFFGLSPNTELFFILFTVIALNIILDSHGMKNSLLAGLLLGVGYIIKPVVLFDFIPFCFLFIGPLWGNWKKMIANIISFGFAFAVPFTIVALYYMSIDEADTFIHFTFNVSGDYLVRRELSIYLTFVIDFFSRFFFVTIPFFVCLFSSRIISRQMRVFIGIWSICIWAGIILPGNTFYHYSIQFMLPFTLLAGSLFDKRRVHGRLFRILSSKKVSIPLLLGFISIILFFQKRDLYDKPDIPRQVAGYLNERISKTDKLYTGDAHQIIYQLTNRSSPIPYIHRTLLWLPEFQNTLSAPFESLFKRIQNDPEITFILQEEREEFIPPDSLYIRDTTIDNITVYRRR